MKITPMDIDGLRFQVLEHPAGRGLRIDQPGYEPIGTYLGLLEDDDEAPRLRRAIERGDGFDSAMVSLRVAGPGEEAEAREAWSADPDRRSPEPDEVLYRLGVAGQPRSPWVPRSTLARIAEAAARLADESPAPPPPWLFRREPLASAPCRLEGMEEVEHDLVEALDQELAAFRLERGEMVHRRTGEPVPEELAERLADRGLLSAVHQGEKLWWLERWGFRNLAAWYRSRDLAEDGAEYGAGAGGWTEDAADAPEPDVEVLERLDREIEELDHWRRDPTPPDAGRAGRITARFRAIQEELDHLGLLNAPGSAERADELRERGLPSLASFLGSAGEVARYYRSAERRERVGDRTAADLVRGSISLEWFRSQEPRAGLDAFEWLAECEARLIAAGADRAGLVFSRFGDRRMVLDVQAEDGVHPRLVAARWV